MKLPDAKRHKYRVPDVYVTSLDYDCLIAESPLEDVVEGDEWGWED